MIFWAFDGSDTCISFKITSGLAIGSCCTSDETPLVSGIASGVSDWKTFAFLTAVYIDVAADPTFRLTAAFTVCKKYFLFKTIEQERKLIYQGKEHLLSKISHHSSVSLGSTDWLLFLRCNNGCTNRWKSGYPKLISLSHGVSKIPFSSWTSRRWARSSGLKCLKQITELRQLSLRTFRLHKIDPSLSLFLRFRTIITIKPHGAWSAIPFCMFLLLLHPLTTHLVSIFTNYIRSLSRKKTSKCAKYRSIVFSILRHIRPRPMPRWPSVANQDGVILTYFEGPWKSRI